MFYSFRLIKLLLDFKCTDIKIIQNDKYGDDHMNRNRFNEDMDAIERQQDEQEKKKEATYIGTLLTLSCCMPGINAAVGAVVGPLFLKTTAAEGAKWGAIIGGGSTAVSIASLMCCFGIYTASRCVVNRWVNKRIHATEMPVQYAEVAPDDTSDATP